MALSRLGAEAVTSDRPEEVLAAELAILPGVGSARSAMDALCERGLEGALRARVNTEGATIGICLGSSLPSTRARRTAASPVSASFPDVPSAGARAACPGVGWAIVEPEAEAFYFARSYAAETPAASAWSEGIVAEARAGSFLGVQFHPEKSGRAGARFLARCVSPA